ncbi:MAG: hypothetical protein JWN86_3165 [Planctomycetota bacterium]|nr:hypothetical protein [Planctomycetota bacterium]
MFAERFRRPSRETTAPRRRLASISGVEALETRQLLAYSPIGSLPDLTVTGQAGATITYGGPLTVTVDVRNLGANSLTEPLALEPNAPSTADSAPSHVGVYLLRTAHTKPGGAGSVLVGEIATPTVLQNSLVRLTQTFTLPSRPPRFPGSGGTIFVGFRADDLRETRDLDRTNNVGNKASVIVNAALPDLAAVAIDVPPAMQPGDTIAPSIKIANFGTVDTATQGPVTVLLVASTDTNFGPNDVILGRYVITDLPGLSQAPASRTVLGDVNIDDAPNIVTLETTATGSNIVILPPGQSFFIGVIVDPLNQIRELHEIGTGPNSALQLVRRVTAIPGLPPAGVLSAASPIENQFPFPAFAPLGSLQDFLGDAAAAAQTINSTGGSSSDFLTSVRGLNRPKPPKTVPTQPGVTNPPTLLPKA